MGGNKFDLEERLIDFSVKIIEISEKLPNTKPGNHIGGQLIRSGTSPLYNYGEAQAAESRADFVHKMKVCLKELRETRVGLILIMRLGLLDNMCLNADIQECNELIAIF